MLDTGYVFYMSSTSNDLHPLLTTLIVVDQCECPMIVKVRMQSPFQSLCNGSSIHGRANSQLGFDIPHSMNLSRPRDRCLFLLSFLTYAYASVGSFVSLPFGLVDIEDESWTYPNHQILVQLKLESTTMPLLVN